MSAGRWKIQLGALAEHDIADILRTTLEMFGPRQVEVYRAILIDALAQLSSGPDILGSTARDEIRPGLRSFYVARRGRNARHFIAYRASADMTVEILRILHNRMDLATHIPP